MQRLCKLFIPINTYTWAFLLMFGTPVSYLIGVHHKNFTDCWYCGPVFNRALRGMLLMAADTSFGSPICTHFLVLLLFLLRPTPHPQGLTSYSLKVVSVLSLQPNNNMTFLTKFMAWNGSLFYDTYSALLDLFGLLIITSRTITSFSASSPILLSGLIILLISLPVVWVLMVFQSFDFSCQSIDFGLQAFKHDNSLLLLSYLSYCLLFSLGVG